MKLSGVRHYAMSLPEVTEQPHHEYGSFRVRGRIFATTPPGEEFIHVFLPEEAREQALALHAGFVEKLLWGGKVRGLRVRLRVAPPSVVKHLLRQAWQHKSPKGVAARKPCD